MAPEAAALESALQELTESLDSFSLGASALPDPVPDAGKPWTLVQGHPALWETMANKVFPGVLRTGKELKQERGADEGKASPRAGP